MPELPRLTIRARSGTGDHAATPGPQPKDAPADDPVAGPVDYEDDRFVKTV
jgi:hypothetical protein